MTSGTYLYAGWTHRAVILVVCRCRYHSARHGIVGTTRCVNALRGSPTSIGPNGKFWFIGGSFKRTFLIYVI